MVPSDLQPQESVPTGLRPGPQSWLLVLCCPQMTVGSPGPDTLLCTHTTHAHHAGFSRGTATPKCCGFSATTFCFSSCSRAPRDPGERTGAGSLRHPPPPLGRNPPQEPQDTAYRSELPGGAARLAGAGTGPPPHRWAAPGTLRPQAPSHPASHLASHGSPAGSSSAGQLGRAQGRGSVCP